MSEYEEEECYEEIPDEEKLQIAQHFITSSPPGQVKEVLKDVYQILPKDLLTDDTLRGAMYQYNTENFLLVSVMENEEHQMIICKDAEIDSSHYIDYVGNRVVGFDHITQKAIQDDIEEIPESIQTSFESERQAIQKCIGEYVKSQYSNQGFVGVYCSNDSKISVCISAERLSLRNFWAGKWHSRWEIDMQNNSNKISGVINLHVHFFEDGNLQLQTEKKCAADLEYDTASSLGDAVKLAIQNAENLIQSNLEEMYLNMSHGTLKEMRRITPVTQTKMDWSIQAHRTARNLRK